MVAVADGRTDLTGVPCRNMTLLLAGVTTSAPSDFFLFIPIVELLRQNNTIEWLDGQQSSTKGAFLQQIFLRNVCKINAHQRCRLYAMVPSSIKPRVACYVYEDEIFIFGIECQMHS